MIWLIAFLALAILGCYFTYKTAEVHELHKMRAAFEDKRHDIEKLIADHKEDASFNDDYYNGELEEIDELESIIDEHIHLLKYFDINILND